MKIFTLWGNVDAEAGDVPYIVDAVDEYTIEANCEFPPEYVRKRAMPGHREMIIDVPENAVRALFDPPVIVATIVKE